MAIISRWRAHAQAVIKQVLEELPDDASMAEVRRVLRESYPFGPREHHPYRMWCAEQRKAIKQRFPDMFGKKKVEMPSRLPNYSLAMVYLPRVSKTRILEAFAPCGWCNTRGCLNCYSRRIKCDAINADPEFRAMTQAVLDGDQVARIALADWLTDKLGEDVAMTW